MSRPHPLRPLCSWLCVSLLWLVFALGQPAPVGAFTKLPPQVNTQSSNVEVSSPPLAPGNQQTIAIGPLGSPMSASPLQVVLDQSVRQSVLAGGWSVLALTSTLSLADPTGSAVRQSGSGHWHVDALEAGSTDKPPAPFALDGTLAFELRVQPRGNTPIAASAYIEFEAITAA